MTTREDTLRDLIDRRRPVAEALAALRGLPWDEDELVDLDVSHVTTALPTDDSGVLDRAQLEAWADAIEGREDIGRSPGQRSLLNEVLMALSTPALFGGLDAAVATVRERLGAAR